MALINKFGVPSLSSMIPPQNAVIGSGKLAGEDIAAGDVCYLHANGTVMRSNGSLADAAAKAAGIAVAAAFADSPVTLMRGIELHYGAGLTPGADLYVGEIAGRLDDAPTTGGVAPVGYVVDASRIVFDGSLY